MRIVGWVGQLPELFLYCTVQVHQVQLGGDRLPLGSGRQDLDRGDQGRAELHGQHRRLRGRAVP